MKPRPPEHLFTLGKVAGPWGRKGLVKVKPLTDFPDRIVGKGELLLWREDKGITSFRVREGRLTDRFLLLGLEGVDDISGAELLRGSLVMVDESRLEPLPEGTFYQHQIIGLLARREDGTALGTVEEIWPTGAHDVYVVRNGTLETLVPAVKELILRIDTKRREITVRMPPEEE